MSPPRTACTRSAGAPALDEDVDHGLRRPHLQASLHRLDDRLGGDVVGVLVRDEDGRDAVERAGQVGEDARGR